MLFYTWFLFAAVWHQSCIHLSVGNQIVVAFDYCISFLSHCCNSNRKGQLEREGSLCLLFKDAVYHRGEGVTDLAWRSWPLSLWPEAESIKC